MQIPSSTIPNTTTDPSLSVANAASQVATAAVPNAVQSNIQLGVVQPGYDFGVPRISIPFDYPVPPAIDRWLEDRGLNHFGDPKDARYIGGSPLYNWRTGERLSRLEYILRQHPQLKIFLPKNHPLAGSPFPQPLPMPMPQPPNLPNIQQLQQMLQQIMNMLSKLLGGWTQPRPQPLPNPMPPVIGLPGMPRHQWHLHQQIRQVRTDIRDLRNEIRQYEVTGQRVPRHLTSKLKFLEQRLAKLQARVQPVYNRPGVMEVGRPLVAVPGGTATQDTSALALGSTQPVTSNHIENLKPGPAVVGSSTPTTSQPVANS